MSRCEDGRFQSFYFEQFSVLPSNMAPLLSIKHQNKIERNPGTGSAVCHKQLKIRLQIFVVSDQLAFPGRGRRQHIAIQTFTIIVNKLPPIFLQDLTTPRKCTRILRNSVKPLEIPFYNRVRNGINSFSFLSPTTLNNLPEEIRTLSDLSSFRKVIAILVCTHK